MPKKKKEQDIQTTAPETANEEKHDIETALETRTIYHQFTESEVNALNEKVTELTKKSRDFAEKKKLMDSIVKGTDAEIANTIMAIDEGGENRSMDCPVIIDYTENTYVVKHPETGDILEKRPLTAAEQQRPLFSKEELDQLETAEEQEEDESLVSEEEGDEDEQ